MRFPVFVYGVLRRGASNAWRMEGATFLGPATVRGTLVKVNWYPGLVLGGEKLVHGEVYLVDEDPLRALDEFEGIGIADSRQGEYERVVATATLADGTSLACQIYQWRLGIEAYPVVENGDWLTVGDLG